MGLHILQRDIALPQREDGRCGRWAGRCQNRHRHRSRCQAGVPVDVQEPQEQAGVPVDVEEPQEHLFDDSK